METISHHNRQTAYKSLKRDTPSKKILCVHGSGGQHRIWKAQLGRLSSEYEIIAVDLSGHGGSDDINTEPGSETLQAYINDIKAVWKIDRPAVLMGNSLGGAVILQAVIDGTIHSEAIILAGSGAKLGVPGHLRTLLEEDFETAVDYLHSDNNLFYDESHPAVAVSKQAMHATGQQVTQRDFLTCHTFDVRDELNESMPPLLALTGEYDELTPPRFHDYLANETGGSSTTIANAAHLSMLEQPNAFNRAIKSFLQAI